MVEIRRRSQANKGRAKVPSDGRSNKIQIGRFPVAEHLAIEEIGLSRTNIRTHANHDHLEGGFGRNRCNDEGEPAPDRFPIMTGTVKFTVDDQIGHLRLNRPEVLNAMDRALLSDLETVLEEALMQARKEIRPLLVLLVSGSGRAFSAGTDLRELESISASAAGELALLENRLMNAVADFPRPTIAAVQGFALGGGCELAMACDLRVAAADAEFGQPEIDMGWLPAAGGTFRLAPLIGRANAMDLILTGRRIGADEAVRMGMVQRLVPSPDLSEEAMSVARTVRDKDPFAIERGLNVLRGRNASNSRAMAVESEAAILAACASRPAAQERVRAFLKR